LLPPVFIRKGLKSGAAMSFVLQMTDPANGPLLLFDLESDPLENVNLIQKAASRARKLSAVFEYEAEGKLRT